MKQVTAQATGSRRSARREGPPAVGAPAAAGASASAVEPLHLPEPRDERLRELSDLLHANPADNSTLVELGRRVGASQRTLTRLFHEELGMGFRQWRTQLRLHLALVLLADGYSVTSTAAACGWANPTSFIEAFAAVLGRTPGHYRAHPQPG
jgi:transcriptional regulator GlxA family with amidase domain